MGLNVLPSLFLYMKKNICFYLKTSILERKQSYYPNYFLKKTFFKKKTCILQWIIYDCYKPHDFQRGKTCIKLP